MRAISLVRVNRREINTIMIPPSDGNITNTASFDPTKLLVSINELFHQTYKPDTFTTMLPSLLTTFLGATILSTALAIPIEEVGLVSTMCLARHCAS